MNIIRPAAINNDIIIKVSPAVRDRWGFTPLVEAHRYKLVWFAFIYLPWLKCCFCGSSLTRLAGSNIRMLSDFLLPSWRTSFQRNWRSRQFHNDYLSSSCFQFNNIFIRNLTVLNATRGENKKGGTKTKHRFKRDLAFKRQGRW